MGYICAKFHQIPTTLLVDAYYGALHVSLQDWMLKCRITFIWVLRPVKIISLILSRVNHKVRRKREITEKKSVALS